MSSITSVSHEPELIAKATAGDREAFAQLYEAVERPLASFLYRLIGLRQVAEDLAQETVLRALETIGAFSGVTSFRVWLFRMAVEAGFERLQGETPWSPDLQVRFGQRLAENDALRRRVRKTHGLGVRATYDIAEHIDYCFMCLGRTLPPHESAALLLAQVYGFSHEETGEVLGAPAETIRSRVEQARQTLVEQLESRCSLINTKGSCGLCAGYHTLLYGDQRQTERALFEINLQARFTPQERAATWDQRLAIVRSIDPLHAEGTRFHESLMTITLEKSHS